MSDPAPDPGAGRPSDDQLEQAILALLARREPSSTICPSEVARALGANTWRELMGPVRDAARRLVAAGRVEITQGGEAVDRERLRGPIRIRRAAGGR
jgi:hypothetical protein